MRNILFYTLLSFTSLLAATPWDGSLKEPNATTVNDTIWYNISDGSELAWFANAVNSGNTYINGRLVDDIVLNEDLSAENLHQWTPIGNLSMNGYFNFRDTAWYNCFRGVFDGQMHTISGLYVNATDSLPTDSLVNQPLEFETGASFLEEKAALFGRSCGTIKNLMLKNSSINYSINHVQHGPHGRCAGIVAQIDSSGVYENLYNWADIICAGKQIGGIIGSIGMGKVIEGQVVTHKIFINNIQNYGSLKKLPQSVYYSKKQIKKHNISENDIGFGGLLGGGWSYAAALGNLTMQNSYNYGYLDMDLDDEGVVFRFQNGITPHAKFDIKNCYDVGGFPGKRNVDEGHDTYFVGSRFFNSYTIGPTGGKKPYRDIGYLAALDKYYDVANNKFLKTRAAVDSLNSGLDSLVWAFDSCGINYGYPYLIYNPPYGKNTVCESPSSSSSVAVSSSSVASSSSAEISSSSGVSSSSVSQSSSSSAVSSSSTMAPSSSSVASSSSTVVPSSSAASSSSAVTNSSSSISDKSSSSEQATLVKNHNIAPSYQISVNGYNVVVANVTNVNIRIFDLLGHQLERKPVYGTGSANFTVAKAGVYILRIGSQVETINVR